MLTPYRVLDLTDERGQLAGQMLAQLGAEVILVEPPDGTRSRRLAPFVDDGPDAGESLWHLARNRGKRSVVLDLAGSGDDRGRFERLVAGADVLIDSGEVDDLSSIGFGVDDLSAINPALVHTSISPFGRSGPKASWAATDLTVWAAAGPLRLTGDPDRAPVRVPGDQAFAHASAEAVGATIAALFERSRSGLGQHVDVSAQQSAAAAMQSTILAVPNGDAPMARSSGGVSVAGFDIQLRWPCKDGHVSVTFLFGTALGPASQRLMDVVHEEGFCDDATRSKDWIGYTELLFTGEEPVEEYERVKRCIHDWCTAHTKAELLAVAMDRRLLIAPVNMLDDVCDHPQFAEREFWDDVGGARHPGPFARAHGTPLRRLAAAPTLGSDTDIVLGEPDRTPSVGTPSPTSVPADIGSSAPSRPLDGVKVLDLMWVVAGPQGTRVLADLGATVVRVESALRVDTARTLQPFKDGENGVEQSMLFANMNAGKVGFAVNPLAEEGREVILDLVRWADVVTESFSPRGMPRLGLEYETLREVNPGLIMLSSCLFGQVGPLSDFAGYGTMAAAVSGFFGVTGWPDRDPCGPFGAYTDYIAPRFANAVLLAALDHRRRIGEGQYIDVAQAEASLHTLAPLVLDYTINGRVPTPTGNDDPNLSPHGAFPADGDDEWVAIACRSDRDREALARIVGGLDDDAIAAWTQTRSVAEIESTLQEAGVPVHGVATGESLTADPQLAHREHFVTVPHQQLGDVVVEGPRFSMSRSELTVGEVPTMGQHNTDVLTEVLGYDDEKMVGLLVGGALE